MQVLFFLVAGMFVGYLFRSERGVLAMASTASTWSLYLLIFLLGISVGADDTVVHALGDLGVRALILSAGGVAGSVLVSCVVSWAFFDVVRCEE